MFNIFVTKFSEMKGRGVRDFKDGEEGGRGRLGKDSARDANVENSNVCKKAGVFYTPPSKRRNAVKSCFARSISPWVCKLLTLGNWIGVTDILVKLNRREHSLLYSLFVPIHMFPQIPLAALGLPSCLGKATAYSCPGGF